MRWRGCIMGMRRRVRRSGLVALRLVLVTGLLIFVCEFAIYPLVISQCSWPQVDELLREHSTEDKPSMILKAMFIADTHLLGPIKGHWLDKLRREWQMHRAFVTAINYFRPEVVFFLGDLFDEGHKVNQIYFDKYVTRFSSLFPVPADTEVYVVPGNHDMGFHRHAHPIANSRFNQAFNTTAVSLVRLKETNFVLMNSMALEMDGCFLCKEGLQQMNHVEDLLECQKSVSSCSKIRDQQQARISQKQEYSPPIILQHFPLYRKSDALCEGDDAAPPDEKSVLFKPSHDCLSKDSTKVLLHSFEPRLILSGHTHHYCVTNHAVKNTIVQEVSVPSFSWRNRNDPSLFLGVFFKDKYLLSKCLMPRESTVKVIYFVGFCTYLYILFPIIKIFKSLRRFVYRSLNL